jgi:Holliday junction DNA helicase RuvA
MISALTGTLVSVDEDRIHLRAGPIVYEALVPAADVPALHEVVGQELTLHTVFYLEGDASGGNLEPRLLAFIRPDDKRFFQKFITVKGIGPKKALRALIYPSGQIARAIESKDTRFLTGLPQIGKRMAELVVAELFGKVTEFAMGIEAMNASAVGSPTHSPAEQDALTALIALGERRNDAENLLDRAKQRNPDLKQANDLIREMLRMRAS